MATAPRFSSIQEIPLEGVDFHLFEVLTSMKQNIELLTGQRNEADIVSKAVTAASVTIPDAGTPTFSGVTATGVSFTVNNVRVPSYDDYTKLLTDVQKLGNDVAELRSLLNTLLVQLRG